MKRTAIACCCLLVACSMPQTYVTADRRTYDAIAPRYAAYVLADATLPPSERDSRLLTLDTWLKRITTQEALK